MVDPTQLPEEDQGEIVEVEDEVSAIEETEDGGAIVRLSEEEESATVEFYGNIVGFFDEATLDTLAANLLEDIKLDKKSREGRDKQYAEALRRTGLGKEAPGGAQFEGASRVVHPMLTEAVVDFASRSVKELMPPNGPVKIFIPGKNISPERFEKAERKKDYMNWQFLIQMPEFRSELEQLLTQLPLGGSMYLRLTPDMSKRRYRPVPVFVPLDSVSIPFGASNFYTAERQTYHEQVSKFEFEERVREGIYRDIPTISPAHAPDPTESQKASDKVEGRKDEGMNKDGLKIVHEVSCFQDFDEDDQAGDGPAPYLISIDEPSGKIVSIVRNWMADDENFERMQWMSDWIFIPWRGAVGVGLGQMIGSLSGAATGALRALLDSGHINNLPTVARLKGANFTGQSKELNATQIVEVEGGVADNADIRKLLMPLPFNEPSQVLFSLLGFLVDSGKGVIHTAFEKMAEGNKNMPVGTTLALIEEGMRIMSAIHLRLYQSMDQTIRILHRIDQMYLTEEQLENDIGEVLAYRSDFENPMDVVPVADPEIFSDVQRLAQLQIVSERAAMMPDLYNRRAVEKRLLERTKIPNPDELLIPEAKPEEMNQVNENVAMTLGRPVAAFPQQDHLAHIQILLDYLISPFLGSLPIIAPTFIPAALQHLKEHVSYWYVNEFYQLLQQAAGVDGEGIAAMMQERDPDTRAEMDRTLAAASRLVIQQAVGTFEKIPAVIQQAQQILSQFQQQPQLPIDPNAMAAIQQKRESDQLKAKTEEGKTQAKVFDIQTKGALKREEIASDERQDQNELMQDREIEFAKLSADQRKEVLKQAREDARQAEEIAARLEELVRREEGQTERAAAKIESDERRNIQDNLTAIRIAAAEIESSEKVGVSTGKGQDPNPSGGSRR